MNKIELLKELKKKLMIPTLVGALAVTSGCTAQKNNEESLESDGKVRIELDNGYGIIDSSNRKVDNFFKLKTISKEKNKMEDPNAISIDYLMDSRFLTDEGFEKFKENYGIRSDIESYSDFVHLIDEKTITSKMGINDGASTMTTAPFLGNYQPVIFPESLDCFDIPLGALDFKITVQKLYTLTNENVLYNFISEVSFDKKIQERYPTLGLDDKIVCVATFKSEGDNLTEIYRHQTGVGSDSLNVSSRNYGELPLMVELDKTIFNDALKAKKYDEGYLFEALDVYSGTDRYYNSKNDGKDFSEFK